MLLVNVGTLLTTIPATKRQFGDKFFIKYVSQLINDISGVLQILLRCFNGTLISTSFVLSFPVFLVIFCVNLNEILPFYYYYYYYYY